MADEPKREVRVLVCGGRSYANAEMVERVLETYLGSYPGLVIASGYDPNDPRFQGADQLAYEWAGRRNVPRRAYPADWKKYGRAAGPIRNQHQLTDFEPHCLVALPGGDGTADMCRRARKHNCHVGYYGEGSAETARLAP